MKVISYYTVGTPYEQEYIPFKESCEKHNIDYCIYAIESLGSWIANCQKKAEIIQQALNLFKQPVVYVDIDARFQAYPDLFDTLRCDVAFHILEHRGELLSGTLYFAYTEPALDLISKWIRENEKNNCWDQRNLQTVYAKHFESIGFSLPAEYCRIYDCHVQKCDEPVIIHYQKSREYKRNVK